jgi:orotidine-5'-phosphate decarboxylase
MKELILALDVRGRDAALKIASVTEEYVDRIKVNYPLVLTAGIGILKDLSKIKPVIADFKIADIPYTSSLIAEIAFENGANAVIVHGFAGSDTLKAVVEVAKKFCGEVFVVTELSSRGGEEIMTKHTFEVIRIAREVGCNGLIAPATRVQRLAEIKMHAANLKILAPGVGFQGGSVEALKYADGIIVGRSIYLAEDPKKAAREYRERVNRLGEE